MNGCSAFHSALAYTSASPGLDSCFGGGFPRPHNLATQLRRCSLCAPHTPTAAGSADPYPESAPYAACTGLPTALATTSPCRPLPSVHSRPSTTTHRESLDKLQLTSDELTHSILL